MGTAQIVFRLMLLFGVSNALAPLYNAISPITNQYIVVLQEGYGPAEYSAVTSITGVESRYEYQQVIKGLGVHLKNTAALTLIRELPIVKFVEEDDLVTVQDLPMAWGLDRVDQRYLPLDGQANYDGDGRGVNAYIIDTGIYPGNEFFGGRAHVAYDASRRSRPGVHPGIDCHGHGTHCAGTVGADRYGIARGATLWGVKVLNCFGSGSWSDIIEGMDWVAANGIRPAVASMSLGGGGSTAVDMAVEGLYNANVTVSVAAGNSDNDACLWSPARAPLAITVGATDYRDYRAYFSCYGSCVDIFAPGVDVLSTFIGSPTATNTWSGTSMACPHVTGAAVIALGNNPSLTPKQVWEKLKADSTSGVLQDKGPQSPDRMLFIPGP